MNGGHYLTKGHAVLCVLYMKTNLMSRNILGPEGTVLRRRQPLAGRRIAPFEVCIRMDHIIGGRASPSVSGSGSHPCVDVFFLTQAWAEFAADFAYALPRPTNPRPAPTAWSGEGTRGV